MNHSTVQLYRIWKQPAETVDKERGDKTMKITLKDGSVKEYASAMSVIDIAKDISEGLARAACAGEMDGETVDLRTVVDKDCQLNILTARDESGLAALIPCCQNI